MTGTDLFELFGQAVTLIDLFTGSVSQHLMLICVICSTGQLLKPICFTCSINEQLTKIRFTCDVGDGGQQSNDDKKASSGVSPAVVHGSSVVV